MQAVQISISSLVEDKESELFLHLWLLDYQGIFFYDDDNREHVDQLDQVKGFLIKNDIKFKEGRRNRSYLSIF